MFAWAMKKIFGTSHERVIRRLQPKVAAIGDLEKSMQKLSDAELRGKTAELKESIDQGATLDELLIPAFAVCREAAWRAVGMRHYKVQLIGGMVLHEGSIAEMKTGEGKTLVATLPCYLNALAGKGVHVITLNDYLARRDAEWMGKIYGLLGLETGIVAKQQSDKAKKSAYGCDITYGDYTEFGFDYLRDSMKAFAQDAHQRSLHYAIVDEVDAILLDDARMPLSLSAQGERSRETAPPATTTVQPSSKASAYRASGREKEEPVTITVQNFFRLYKKLSGMTATADTEATELRATYKLEVVVLPTTEPMTRTDGGDLIYKTEREKYSALLNEIIEKHEKGQPILIGTTGVEKSDMLSHILSRKGLRHRVLKREDLEKDALLVAQAGRKGAITISTNMAGFGTDIALGGDPELLARLELQERSRTPEADPKAFSELVAKLRVSCAKEGDEVRRLGGLYVLGTERHGSRRMDNQLRERAGCRGEPGISRFYLSLEDELIRFFAGDKLKQLMERMGMPDDEPIEHPWVNKSVENAQKRLEKHNFGIRKNLSRMPP